MRGKLVFQNKTGNEETRQKSKQNVSKVRDMQQWMPRNVLLFLCLSGFLFFCGSLINHFLIHGLFTPFIIFPSLSLLSCCLFIDPYLISESF